MAERDYIIAAERGEGTYLLATCDEPLAMGRLYDAESDSLSDAKWVAEFVKFGYFEPYTGAQDILTGKVPDTVFDGVPRHFELHQRD